MNFALILSCSCCRQRGAVGFDHFVASKRRSVGAKSPWWVEYGASFFPVILVVFCLRSFVVEPFKIPSGSMIPTLLVGDFILVNKWTYGIRLPVINKKIVEVNQPQRGDVMVFRFPAGHLPRLHQGSSGCRATRSNTSTRSLTINGQAMPQTPDGDYLHARTAVYSPRFTEKLGAVEHKIIVENDAPPFVSPSIQYPFRDNCTYTNRGVSAPFRPGTTS